MTTQPKSLLTVLALAAAASGSVAEPGAFVRTRGDTTRQAGTVLWSDGRTQTGVLRVGGGEIRLHDGARLHRLPQEGLLGLSFSPSQSTMERAWRFLEAGQTAKAYEGDPYPVMQIETLAALRGGRTISGRLITTVLHIETDTGTEKRILRTKLRGNPGESHDDISYPRQIRFTGSDGAPAGPVGRRITVKNAPPGTRLAAASLSPLQTLAVRGEGPDWEVDIEGAGPMLALAFEDALIVGWPAGVEAAAPDAERVRTAIADARDFFDARTVLGVAQAPDETDFAAFIALVLLERRGGTTLAAEASQPWRLALWRIRFGEEDDRLFGARTALFRGIKARGAPAPRVLLAPRLAPGQIESALSVDWPLTTNRPAEQLE